MKKTKESNSNIDKILEFTSQEDVEEFRRVASGRKFFKKGERLIDICDEEIEKYKYERSNNIFIKIFKHYKIKKNKEKLMLENRVSNIIRTIANIYIKDAEDGNIDRDIIILKVREAILEKVSTYNKDTSKSK